MATQGTEKILGGTTYKRYPDPVVKGTPNGYGLYPWSAFRATLGDINNALFVPQTDGSLDGLDVALLLFTSDIPVIAKLSCINATQYLQYDAPVFNGTTVPFLVTTSGGSTAVVSAGIGAVASGYAGQGSAVFVSGFPAATQPFGADIADTSLYVLDCIANGATIAGVVSANLLTTSTSQAPQPVILLNTAYTKAMRDAGNLYADSAGRLYQIVGLFEVVAVP